MFLNVFRGFKMSFCFSKLAYAYGKPEFSARLKVQPEDFLVAEKLAYELSGEGEHLWLWVEKTSENTVDLVQQLSRWAKVSDRNIGYAGKKDRQAVTRQWISIHLPGKPNPSLQDFDSKTARILKIQRHHRKLQRGGLAGNRFELVLRDLKGNYEGLISRCELVQQQGVPNYFGEQRFGKNMGNLQQAIALFAGHQRRVKHHQKSLYLSSARSWIFNQILSQRVASQTWSSRISGDVFMLEGSTKCFVYDADKALEKRLLVADIHPTGLLTGRGDFLTTQDMLKLEQEVIQSFADWQLGLEKSGMKQERRALRVMPKEMAFRIEDESLYLSFELPAGSYATMVVRELLVI